MQSNKPPDVLSKNLNNKSVKSLSQWLKEKLSLNISKTEIITFQKNTAAQMTASRKKSISLSKISWSIIRRAASMEQ